MYLLIGCIAWNDFDGVPRSMTPYAHSHASITGELGSMGPGENHGGSRNRLLFIRKQRIIEGNQQLLDYADSKNPPLHNTRRMNLITNTDIENGR